MRNEKLLKNIGDAISDYINYPMITAVKSYKAKREDALIHLMEQERESADEAKKALEVLENKKDLHRLITNARKDQRMHITNIIASAQQNRMIIGRVTEEFDRLKEAFGFDDTLPRWPVTIAEESIYNFDLPKREIDWSFHIIEHEKTDMPVENVVSHIGRGGKCNYPNCGRQFKLYGDATRHARNKHLNPDQFQCKICSEKYFSRRYNCQQHVINIHSGALKYVKY